ncbi:unnamed protein product [Peronospora farinosa]|uniref:Hydrophobin n=1 Tax=Peronospora farinosa TaxID=134698 RepID=A0AAV0T2A2_9STRA|nr:unnamed protein product [Peronospora farinosa]
MFSKILIVAGILASTLASADVPLSVQHDATNSLVESVGIASTRNLRVMTEQTALGETTTQASQCDNIGSGDAQLANGLQLLNLDLLGNQLLDLDLLGNQLLDLDVLGSVAADNIQSCCNACVNSVLCIAFNFQPLLSLEACVLSRSRVGRQGGLINLSIL